VATRSSAGISAGEMCMAGPEAGAVSPQCGVYKPTVLAFFLLPQTPTPFILFQLLLFALSLSSSLAFQPLIRNGFLQDRASCFRLGCHGTPHDCVRLARCTYH